MMPTKKVKLSDALKKGGKTPGSVKTMSDEEIHRRALRDPDNLPLSGEQLAQFRPTSQMDRMEIKREALRAALHKTGKFSDDELESMSTDEMKRTLFDLRKSDEMASDEKP